QSGKSIAMLKEFAYRYAESLPLTVDISLLTFIPIEQPLIYVAGQYVEVELNGTLMPLSIANAPQIDGKLEFHLRHNPSHPLAEQFLTHLKTQQVIYFRGPFGHCTLANTQPGQSLLFLAGGTGFAMIKALLIAAFVERPTSFIELYWGISRPEDAYDEKLLKKWQKDHSQFHYTLVLSKPEEFPAWQGPTGFVHEYCAKQHPHFQKQYVFASGPYAMVMGAKTLFTRQRLNAAELCSDMLVA
ncbi:MAG: FAD-binding oxidoreductase, partial [Candidatus Berkiellales bacterium]